MIKTILFDMDGTLLDTASDLTNALNQLRARHRQPALSLASVRPHVGHGAAAMLKHSFNIESTDPNYKKLHDEFLALYENQVTNTTRFFDGMGQVLDTLEANNIQWGIVTNKPARFTDKITKAMQLDQRAACIISGDTLPKRKPEPDQIVHALGLLNESPSHCLYVGDTKIDVVASKAAGTRSLVALYGYIYEHEQPQTWQADGYIHQPLDLLNWLAKQNSK